jgi:hypothetical protein
LQEVSVQLRKTDWPTIRPAGIVDQPADVASGLVSFHVSTEADPADCADVLADLLILSWEGRKSPKRKARKQGNGPLLSVSA